MNGEVLESKRPETSKTIAQRAGGGESGEAPTLFVSCARSQLGEANQEDAQVYAAEFTFAVSE